MRRKRGALGSAFCTFSREGNSLVVMRTLPKWPVHRLIDRVYLGNEYPKVHRGMDGPAKYSKKPRRTYFHNYTSSYVVAREKYPDDPDAVWNAWLHIVIDDMCTREPEHRKFLERMEKLFREKKKKTRKRIKKKMFWEIDL